jgi:FkbM family methyltransferase
VPLPRSAIAIRVKGRVRALLDERAPFAAKVFRATRDKILWRMATPVDTGLGFVLQGAQGMAKARSESNEIGFISRCVSEACGCHFIDAGANVGFFSCLAASLGSHVIAIEPHPLNLRTLYKNLRLNKFTDVEVYPIALSDTYGVADLFGGGQGASLLKGWGHIHSNYKTPTAINTLDNILTGRFEGERLIIKIDTEGNEYEILRGAQKTLTRRPSPVWLAEIGLSENFGEYINPRFYATFDLFWSQGYVALSVEANRAVSQEDVSRWICNGRRDFGFINFLFRRPD